MLCGTCQGLQLIRMDTRMTCVTVRFDYVLIYKHYPSSTVDKEHVPDLITWLGVAPRTYTKKSLDYMLKI